MANPRAIKDNENGWRRDGGRQDKSGKRARGVCINVEADENKEQMRIRSIYTVNSRARETWRKIKRKRRRRRRDGVQNASGETPATREIIGVQFTVSCPRGTVRKSTKGE